MDKFINQFICCFIITMALFISQEVNNEYVTKGRDYILNCLEKNYTSQEIITAGQEVISCITEIPTYVSSAVLSANATLKYGVPIDEEIGENESASIYSVGGGIVVTTGENDEIGKYIIIAHGNEAESVYGNLETIVVEPMERVKKGELIATYCESNEKDFYYAFSFI